MCGACEMGAHFGAATAWELPESFYCTREGNEVVLGGLETARGCGCRVLRCGDREVSKQRATLLCQVERGACDE